MEGYDNTTEFVSSVQVTYNDTFGYPQRILIVYDSPTADVSEATLGSYNESTFFATITNVKPLNRGTRSLVETPVPSIEDSTTMTTYSELEKSQEVFDQARSLWDSHYMIDYQFDYDVLFDTIETGADRQATPYPWRVVVDDLHVKTVTDAKGNLLFPLATVSPSSFDASSNASNETTTQPLSTPNVTMDENVESEESNVAMGANQTTPPTEQPQLEVESEQSEAPAANASNSIAPPIVPPPSNQLPGGAIPGGLPGGLPPLPGGGRGEKGPKLVDSILKASFRGASGAVSFQYDIPKSRDMSGVPVGAFNIRPSQVGESTGHRTFDIVVTSYAVLTNSTTLDDWHSVPDESFVYADGSTGAPVVLRQIDDQNFLSQWVHIFGLTLFSIALFLALSSALAVWYFRNDRTMRAGQPPFLYILCAGSALMSVAIFTLSWDESYGWSNKQLDVACTLTPWFFFVGHLLMFSALFSKLWRVDKVLQFSRRKVRVIQVLGPMILLLLAAIVVLSVWSAIDPWVWERTLIQDSPAETYGECTSEHFAVWMSILVALIVLAKVTTFAMAWKTADIPQDFSDASSVFYAISTHLQAWFIGIPILIVLGNDSPDATYFGRVLLIWIFSVSGVGLVVVPKIVKSIQVRRNPELLKKNRVRVSGMPDSQPPISQQSRSRASSAMDESAQHHLRASGMNPSTPGVHRNT